ncbi:hypothetical protein BT93_F0005 [Corymbia citriodora subsp. variegata]|nr:hypothetical protein BT93_F0005 [Corymbia citriodora subsp. variegata]
MKVVQWLLPVAVAWWLGQGGAPTMAGECATKCGDVDVPYPFGLELKCARSKIFFLNCTTEGNHPKLRLASGWDYPIRNISVENATMVISVPEVYFCPNRDDQAQNNRTIDLSRYPLYKFSDTWNKLTVLGCNIHALVFDPDWMFVSGCASYCSRSVSFANEATCSGHRCCQTSIPKGLKTLVISVHPLDKNFSACGVAFVANEMSFNISKRKSPTIKDVGQSSELVLDWMVEWDVTCKKARSRSGYACGNNTACKDFPNESGYRCLCKPGYKGNPYNRSHGCQAKRNPCPGKCKNTIGSYICQCRFGMQPDPDNKFHCQISHWTVLVAGIASSIFGIISVALVFDTWRRRSKQKNFRQNGGKLLKHHRVKIFTEAELAKATNNYDDNNKLGEGGFGSVYRGRIVANTMVAIKKPKNVHKSLIRKDFQHELETVMQMNHKNVVKLHGICLETRIPLLVYEYISNGTLFQHIHQSTSTILRSWKTQLRIAAEAALALEYMHSYAEPPIIHGDIKSMNILLDHNYSAKVSDFGTSVLISPKHSNIVATEIQGTLGYIDPEYLTTGMITIMSDVYSFGAVLVELLTGKMPISFITKSGESINIIHYFISSVKDKTLSDVINLEDASEEEMERVGMVAEIAVKCLGQSGARRPVMREVAEQLTRINHELDSLIVEENIEETECKVDEANLYPHATSITCETSQHGTSSSFF